MHGRAASNRFVNHMTNGDSKKTDIETLESDMSNWMTQLGRHVKCPWELFLIDKFDHDILQKILHRWMCRSKWKGKDRERERLLFYNPKNITQQKNWNRTDSHDFHIHSIEHLHNAKKKWNDDVERDRKLTRTEVLLLLLIELQIKIKRDWRSQWRRRKVNVLESARVRVYNSFQFLRLHILAKLKLALVFTQIFISHPLELITIY